MRVSMLCEFVLTVPIHSQKASRYWGRQFLRSCGFEISYNDLRFVKLVINLRQ